MGKEIKKQDIILITALLAISAVLFAVRFQASKIPVKEAEILVDGETVRILSLNEDTELVVSGVNGGTNHIIVRDGQVWCDEASCPDKICVHTGKISLSTQTIACLPNKMVIRIKGD